jgi:hypothetical protein
MTVSTLLLVILVLLLVGALPVYPHSAQWGYGPSGALGVLVVLLLVLLLLGRL